MTTNGQGPANSDVVIDVRGLNKHFGENHAVKDLTLTVRRGEIFGFLGPNGSGKTTSIRMLCGLLTPDSGEGTCLGYDIRRQTPEIKRHVGYMTQRFTFWEDLTIRENLRLYRAHVRHARRRSARRPGARSAGTRDAREPAGRLAVGRLETAPRAGRLPVASTRSCCCSTSRPQASIRRHDATSGKNCTASPARGITVLVSTHYMDEAERCHQLAYILYGRLLVQGTAAEVIASQSLTTWEVSGGDLPALADRCAVFRRSSRSLHSATRCTSADRDRDALGSALAPLMNEAGHEWRQVEPGLEDVFIHLMRDADDAPAPAETSTTTAPNARTG